VLELGEFNPEGRIGQPRDMAQAETREELAGIPEVVVVGRWRQEGVRG
jgi:hypothetical protein